MSTINQMMQRKLKQIAHTASIREAAMRMSSERVGSLMVERKGQLVGIVTDTDIVRKAAAAGKSLDKETVESIMSSPIATIEGNRSVQDAHDMMGDLGIRHLGVTEKGNLVGLVSVRDLLVYFKRVSEPKIAQD
ncbi:MAG: CBS domain-containing protein [Nitrospirota bacterium]